MTSVEEPMRGEVTKQRLATTLLWRIENISFWDPKFHENIDSPDFEFLNTGACCLDLWVQGAKEDDKKLDCRFQYHKDISSLDYEWSVLDGKGLPIVTRMVRNATLRSFEYVALFDFPTYKDVFKTNKSLFLPNDTLTLRCRFWESEKGFEQSEYISGYTRIFVTEGTFLWRIKEFSNLQLEQEVISPIHYHFFSVFSEKQASTDLKFSLKGHSLTDAVATLEIIFKDYGKEVLTTNISILDHEYRTMKSFKSETYLGIVCSIHSKWSCLVKCTSRQEILNRKSDWLHDDVLTLLCQFHSVMDYMEDGIDKSYYGPENLKTVIPRNHPSVSKTASVGTQITDLKSAACTVLEESSQTTTQSTDGLVIPLHKTNSVATLHEDLLSLYTDHTLSDFELRSGDASIPVHKNILSARSTVFNAMFCGDMKEASSDFLEVPDLDVHTLNRMLTFMYTGNVDHLEWESAAKLYYAADKYQVQTLKQECLHLLQSGISVQNASDILELADRHQDGDLELFVHDFIARHYDEVVLSEEWEKFLDRNGTLAGKAMRDVYKKKLQKEGK